MSPVLQYIVSNWLYIYFLIASLIFVFFVTNTRPIYKLRFSELGGEHWVAIIVTTFLWLPVLFGITLINKFRKKDE